MNLEGIELPPGLIAPKRATDPAFAARRAEVLLGQIKSAKDRGILTVARCLDALGELNRFCMDVGAMMNAANAAMLRVYPQTDGTATARPHGTLEQMTAYSTLLRQYMTVYDTMTVIEGISKGLR